MAAMALEVPPLFTDGGSVETSVFGGSDVWHVHTYDKYGCLCRWRLAEQPTEAAMRGLKVLHVQYSLWRAAVQMRGRN